MKKLQDYTLIACMLIASPAAAQDDAQPIVIGERFAIESRILGGTRQVFIGTPEFYDEGTQSYGVLYVLDGEYQFLHALGTTQFLGGPFNQTIPPLLVVAIGTAPDRMLDLTPPLQAQQEAGTLRTQGGADQFLRFIVEELKPWVNEHYRTNDYSALIGHSLGGLFGLFTFMTQPDAFNDYLLISPSLGWNEQSLVRQGDAFINGEPELNASLYLTVGNEEGPALGGLRKFVGILDTRTPPGLRWQFSRITAQTHDTVSPVATYQGLQWIFASWDVEDEATAMFGDAPGEDILEDIDDLYRSSGEQWGFERSTPYLVFESLLNYLALNDRLQEAAALTLRHTDRYPLMPNVVAGIAELYLANGNEDAAVEYLSAVLDSFPDYETARRALTDMGIDLPAD